MLPIARLAHARAVWGESPSGGRGQSPRNKEPRKKGKPPTSLRDRRPFPARPSVELCARKTGRARWSFAEFPPLVLTGGIGGRQRRGNHFLKQWRWLGRRWVLFFWGGEDSRGATIHWGVSPASQAMTEWGSRCRTIRRNNSQPTDLKTNFLRIPG